MMYEDWIRNVPIFYFKRSSWWTPVPDFRTIRTKICRRHLTKIKKCQHSGRTRLKASGSPKSLGFILWSPWMNVWKSTKRWCKNKSQKFTEISRVLFFSEYFFLFISYYFNMSSSWDMSDWINNNEFVWLKKLTVSAGINQNKYVSWSLSNTSLMPHLLVNMNRRFDLN